MTELFTIFGDDITTKALKNVARQPMCNDENRGKTFQSGQLKAGPLKPNEPVKKGEIKKSFLSNIGKNVQGTPLRKPLTPRSVNIAPVIYNDAEKDNFCTEDLQFTKPNFSYDKYMDNMFNLIPIPELNADKSPPNTPPPNMERPSMDFDCSYEDEFFKDDFSCENDSDLDLPDLY